MDMLLAQVLIIYQQTLRLAFDAMLLGDIGLNRCKWCRCCSRRHESLSAAD